MDRIRYEGDLDDEHLPTVRMIGDLKVELPDAAAQREGFETEHAHILISGGYGYKRVEPLGKVKTHKTLAELTARRGREREVRAGILKALGRKLRDLNEAERAAFDEAVAAAVDAAEVGTPGSGDTATDSPDAPNTPRDSSAGMTVTIVDTSEREAAFGGDAHTQGKE